MILQISPSLDRIIKNANTLVEFYESEALTQEHLILAFLLELLQARINNNLSPELEYAVQYAPVGSDTNDLLIKSLIEHLELKLPVSEDEKENLHKIFEALGNAQEDTPGSTATAEQLLKQIRLHAYGIVNSLFELLDLRFSTETVEQFGYRYNNLTRRPNSPLAHRKEYSIEANLFGLLSSTFEIAAKAVAKKAQPKASTEPLFSSEEKKQETENSFDFTFVVDNFFVFPNKKASFFPEEKKLLDKDYYNSRKLEEALRKVIYGQNEAISTMATGYYKAKSKGDTVRSSNKPLATFLFAGAPGVGKTFLAEKAAEALGLPFKRFDMSSFSHREATIEFSGSDNVYKNSHEGLVTGFVKNNPHCVLLFDEIEKAHETVIQLFLQILDNATLKDSFLGKNINFNQTIIIMTTNAGKNLYDLAESRTAPISRKVIVNALKNDINPQTNEPFFPAAICSRFAMGNIVIFNPLKATDILSIINSRIEKYVTTFSYKHNIKVSVDERVPVALLFSEGGKGDARSLSGRSENFIAQEIYNWLKFATEAYRFDVPKTKRLNIKLNINKYTKDVRSLFVPQGKMNVLVYSEFEAVSDFFKNNKHFNFIFTSDYNTALDIVAREELDFAICDIRSAAPTTTYYSINVEDILTSGRKLFEALKKENIPFYVYDYQERINPPEELALKEQGARDLFSSSTNPYYIEEQLEEIRLELNYEKKLNELARANKVLFFDCSYEYKLAKKEGTILIDNLHISPAIDAEDLPEIASVSASSVKFNDIIGAEDAKAELKDFVSYLKNPRLYARNGIPAPKGVLLYGPPGTGKTMLAKALASEAGATFIATQGNQFLKPLVGDAGNEVKKIFALARKYAPSILFIDEIDIIAKNRMGDYASASGDEAVNALLNEMDGFSTNPSKPVFVLGATNFDSSFGSNSELDPALLRRFDRRIFVALPDKADRMKFIRQRLEKSNKTIDNGFIENIAIRSTEMSLAELDNVIDFALRQMLRADKTDLTPEILDEAFETFRFGEKLLWNKQVLKRVAIHESGHAFVSYKRNKPPLYVSVSSRGSFGGYVMHDLSDSPILTKSELLDEICICLAGRAAETVFLGEDEGISTGASSDLRKATSIAMQMITQFGMTTEGLAVDETPDDNKDALNLCNEILNAEMENARRLILENKDKIQLLADTLAEKNHLTGSAVNKLLKKG